jgi:hypothetical protein
VEFTSSTSTKNEIWNDWLPNDVFAGRENFHTIGAAHHFSNFHEDYLCDHDNIDLLCQGHAHGNVSKGRKRCPDGRSIPMFTFAFSHGSAEQELDAAVARYYTFKTEDNEMCMRTYSAHEGRHLTDSTCSGGQPCHEHCWDSDMSL